MRISVHHQFSVTPPAGTAHLVLQLLLTPRSGPAQTVTSWAIDMPGIDSGTQFDDAYGNRAHLVNRAKPEGELLVAVRGVVETRDTHGILGKPIGEPVPALFKRITPLTRVPGAIYDKLRDGKDSRIDMLHGLMLRVSETLSGQTGAEQQQDGPKQSQSQSQTQGSTSEMRADGTPLIAETGDDVVSRLPRPPAADYAHMFIGAARALGIPARYVTGYLVGDDEEPAAFHAWAEAYDDKLGWIGFDAMLELCPTDRHVRLAVGLDAHSAAPLRCVPAGDGVAEIEVLIEALQV